MRFDLNIIIIHRSSKIILKAEGSPSEAADYLIIAVDIVIGWCAPL